MFYGLQGQASSTRTYTLLVLSLLDYYLFLRTFRSGSDLPTVLCVKRNDLVLVLETFPYFRSPVLH